MHDEIRPNPGNPKDATCSIRGALLVCLSCGEHRDKAMEQACAKNEECKQLLRALEWCIDGQCPICGAGIGGQEFHTPECTLWGVLAKTIAKPAELTAEHSYISTACFHGQHESCRQSCKFCRGRCRCSCHLKSAEPPTEGV